MSWNWWINLIFLGRNRGTCNQLSRSLQSLLRAKSGKLFLHSFFRCLCAGFCIKDLDELVVCVCTSAAARSMGWWCRICNQGNDSKSLSGPSIQYSGIYCSLDIHSWDCYARLKFPRCDMADFEVWTTTNEQSHGCKPWSFGIHSGDAVPVLICVVDSFALVKHSVIL